ncbi:MAG: SPOR domain-containing protein [Pseudomonadota bacterium]
MIEGEFEDAEDNNAVEQELDLSEDDSLPWLESDDDEGAGGFDFTQFAGLAAILLALMAVIVGGIWFFTNRTPDAEVVADGSTIEAPDGPYKVKPDDRGGKEFEGTGNVAPGVGEGKTPDGKMADGSDAAGEGASGSGGASGDGASGGDGSSSSASSGSASSASGVGVQVAAFGSRARAEKGWEELSGNSSALEGVRYRIVKAEVSGSTVYRLQAVASDKAAADKLCKAIKADGLACTVKP